MMAHIGPVRVRKLLEVFGEPQRILQAKASELGQVEGLPRNTIDALLNWENELDLQGELERIRQFGATVLTQDDPLYSPLLRQIYDPPLVLYVLVKLEERDHNALGIVASRRTTHNCLYSPQRPPHQLP